VSRRRADNGRERTAPDGYLALALTGCFRSFSDIAVRKLPVESGLNYWI